MKNITVNELNTLQSGGTTLDRISSTCPMFIRCGSTSASFRNRINDTALIFLFCSSTSR